MRIVICRHPGLVCCDIPCLEASVVYNIIADAFVAEEVAVVSNEVYAIFCMSVFSIYQPCFNIRIVIEVDFIIFVELAVAVFMNDISVLLRGKIRDNAVAVDTSCTKLFLHCAACRHVYSCDILLYVSNGFAFRIRFCGIRVGI